MQHSTKPQSDTLTNYIDCQSLIIPVLIKSISNAYYSMFIFIICMDNIWTQTCLNEGPRHSLLINAYKSCPSKATLSDMGLRNTNTEAVTIDMNFMVLHTTHYPLHIQQSKVHEPIVDVMGQSQQYQTPYQVYKAHTLLSQAQVTSSPHPCIAGAAKINWLLLEYAIER